MATKINAWAPLARLTGPDPAAGAAEKRKAALDAAKAAFEKTKDVNAFLAAQDAADKAYAEAVRSSGAPLVIEPHRNADDNRHMVKFFDGAESIEIAGFKTVGPHAVARLLRKCALHPETAAWAISTLESMPNPSGGGVASTPAVAESADRIRALLGTAR